MCFNFSHDMVLVAESLGYDTKARNLVVSSIAFEEALDTGKS